MAVPKTGSSTTKSKVKSKFIALKDLHTKEDEPDHIYVNKDMIKTFFWNESEGGTLIELLGNDVDRPLIVQETPEEILKLL